MKFTLLDGSEDNVEQNPTNQEELQETQEVIENNESEENKEEELKGNIENQEKEEEYEYIDIESNEELIDYVKNNPEVLNQLSPKEQKELPEEVKRYLEFREETNGRSYYDFLQYQQDFSEMDSEEKVKRYIAENNPTFSKEDVEDEYKERFSFDEDIDDESDIKKKQRELKKISANADKYFDEAKEKWGKPLGSDETNIPKEYVESKKAWDEFQQQQSEVEEVNKDKSNYFMTMTEDMFHDEFKGFEFKVGEDVIQHDVNNVDEVLKSQTDLNSFFNKFLDSDGYIEDVEGYHKAIYVLQNYESIIENVYNTAIANHVKKDAEDSKNIDMGRSRKSPETIKSGLKMKIVN